jgi:hypothetical protein
MARQGHEEFADLLAALKPAPTLCERSRVRDV